MHITINSFDDINAASQAATDEKILEHRKELRLIRDELHKVMASEKSKPNGDRYHVKYGAMCSPADDSLFVLEIKFTPS